MRPPYLVPKITPAFATHLVGSVATAIFAVIGVQAVDLTRSIIQGNARVLGVIALTSAALANIIIWVMRSGRSPNGRLARALLTGGILGPLNAGLGMLAAGFASGLSGPIRFVWAFTLALVIGSPVCIPSGLAFGVLYHLIDRSVTPCRDVVDESATRLAHAALWLLGIGLVGGLLGSMYEPRIVSFTLALTWLTPFVGVFLFVRRSALRRWLADVRAGKVSGWRIVKESVPRDVPALWKARCGTEVLEHQHDEAAVTYRAQAYEPVARLPD